MNIEFSQGMETARPEAWCANCGRSLKPRARSCRHCGVRIPGISTTNEPFVVVILTFVWSLATLFLLLATDPLPSGAWSLWLFPLLMVPYMLAFMLPYAFVIIQAVYRLRRSDYTPLGPGRLALVTSAWGFVCLLYESEPLVEPFTVMPPLFFGLALVVSWGLFLIPAAWGAWKRRGRGWIQRIAGYLLPLPVGIIVLFAAGSYNGPLRARFELSEGALYDRVQRFERGDGVSPTESQLVGLYTVESIFNLDECVVLQTNSGIDLQAGFGYCASGGPAKANEDMDHLTGKWWVYSYFH